MVLRIVYLRLLSSHAKMLETEEKGAVGHYEGDIFQLYGKKDSPTQISWCLFFDLSWPSHKRVRASTTKIMGCLVQFFCSSRHACEKTEEKYYSYIAFEHFL
jgi:hypothetical protein